MISLDDDKYMSVENLLSSNSAGIARLAEGHLPPDFPCHLWPSTDGSSSIKMNDALNLPSIDLVSYKNVELHANFTSYIQGEPITSDYLFPEYVSRYFESGLVKRHANVKDINEIEGSAFCVSHFNMRTYGHFLLEVLPKILLAKELQQAGFKIPIAFPSYAGPISNIVADICSSDAVIFYNSRREILKLSTAIFPSMMISQDYRGHLHNLFIALVRRMSLQNFLASSLSSIPVSKLFLSRSKWKGYRTATNEDELYSVASEYGFELVHPQDLSWPDQVRMFYGASHVISAYNSALHGAIFCQTGTKVISLGRVNELQEGISASLGHEIGFLHPVKGEISLYDPSAPKPQYYEIDPVQLRLRLDGIFA